MLATVRPAGVRALPFGTRMTAALFAAVFGAALIHLTLFAQSAVVHGAAHDVRHATVAPCH